MRVTVLYNEPSDPATAEDGDVLVQRDAIVQALDLAGHATDHLGCTLDLQAARQRLRELRPDVVFNLVESLGETDRLMPLATLLLDALAIPYTGAPTNAILTTSNKLTAKMRLREAGLPTPAFAARGFPATRVGTADQGRWIIKSVWEHASFGLDDSAVVRIQAAETQLDRWLQAREDASGRPHFAEQFVDGREFNLSLLDGEVLPAAEIDFSLFPAEKPRIVGRSAKWAQHSFEYQQTPRCFDFPASDVTLLAQLTKLARRCWELFELCGYARVDFRVDRHGQPWILEVNVNPCLSPDAGFAAALTQAGIPYHTAVQRIVSACCQRAVACEPASPRTGGLAKVVT